MADETTKTEHRYAVGHCPKCSRTIWADLIVATYPSSPVLDASGRPTAKAYSSVSAVQMRPHSCGEADAMSLLLEARAKHHGDDRTERDTWLEGFDDGSVAISCKRESCMTSGNPRPGNPEGRYIGNDWLPHHPTAVEAQAMWDAHVARHVEEAPETLPGGGESRG